MRLVVAILIGKLVAFLSRRLGMGGGTTLPGTVARRVDPRVAGKVAAGLRDGVILVTGTNGKTTTARLVARTLQQAGYRVVHNRSGANLLGGVTSALVACSDWRGKPRANVGLFEVDEATLPLVSQELRPRALVITNLFRDQLDRYGEVDYVAARWREALARLPGGSIVLLNSDDPVVAGLGDGLPGQVVYFGIEDEAYAVKGKEHTADIRFCTECGGPYDYSVTFYAHLGKYRCRGCGRQRPAPQVRATELALKGTSWSHFTASTPAGDVSLHLPVPGLYNVYNALAAVGACEAVGVGLETVKQSIEGFAAAFGRTERVGIGGRTAYLALVKNPVGFDQVLRTVLLEPGQQPMLIILNDNIADGTDVSWIWDVSFEMLRDRVEWVVAAGTRAEDMAVRLKYAGVEVERILLEKDLDKALDLAVGRVAPGGTLYVLPTYTAMLQIRAVMQKRGLASPFWED